MLGQDRGGHVLNRTAFASRAGRDTLLEHTPSHLAHELDSGYSPLLFRLARTQRAPSLPDGS